jgi:hypothetical protein
MAHYDRIKTELMIFALSCIAQGRPGVSFKHHIEIMNNRQQYCFTLSVSFAN